MLDIYKSICCAKVFVFTIVLKSNFLFELF